MYIKSTMSIRFPSVSHPFPPCGVIIYHSWRNPWHSTTRQHHRSRRRKNHQEGSGPTWRCDTSPASWITERIKNAPVVASFDVVGIITMVITAISWDATDITTTTCCYMLLLWLYIYIILYILYIIYIILYIYYIIYIYNIIYILYNIYIIYILLYI